MPAWLHLLAIISLSVGGVCALVIALDELKHPQHMWIMNVVWPVTALFGSIVILWGYFAYGRLATHEKAQPAMKKGEEPPAKKQSPFSIMVAKGALHCGSGCCIGDILAEWLAFFVPAIAVWLGWHWIFPDKIFAVWVLDFIFAFALGVAFQYFTIKPMRKLSPGQGLVQALKADVLSLTAWQIGMYGLMAFAHFYLFKELLGIRLEVNSVEFWFTMQTAMIAGFITSYPVNWWLIRTGVKERM